MLWLVLATAVAAPDAAAGVPLTRSVALHVYTKKLAPVEDLKVEELMLTEDGKPRKVLSVEPDRRPLELALVVDSSASVTAYYRSDLVPAVVDFIKALPAGSKAAVWSSAPAKVGDFGAELPALTDKLKMIAAAGGNYAFDSMTDACKELGQRGAPRRAVVYVGANGLHSTASSTSALMQAVGQNRVVPMVVMVLASARGALGSGPSGDSIGSWDVQGYFTQMTKAYHGTYVEALTTLAVAQWLKQAAADLNSQYRVRFESVAGPGGVVKVDVKRKDTRFRVGRSAVEEQLTAN
ncbi:MAG TPA: hypothetical protein VMX54_16315 [Vicinamibacteria bacterium]|nr:hypothetical protein [Vicinamibacteria bacterium]